MYKELEVNIIKIVSKLLENFGYKFTKARMSCTLSYSYYYCVVVVVVVVVVVAS